MDKARDPLSEHLHYPFRPTSGGASTDSLESQISNITTPVADSSIKLESDKAFPVFETPNVIAEQVESIEGPFIIGVAGGGAAGKSQVCGMIMRALVSTTGAIRAHSQVRHIRLEDFYFSLTEEEVRLADAGEYNFDHPDAIDLKLFHKCLQDISTGNPVDIPQYDFQKKQRLAETIRIMPPDVVIVSGILIMYQRKTRDLINLKVFVDVDSDVRLAKQVIRDTEVRHHMTLEQVLDRYAKFVKPSFEEFIFHTKKFADVIIPRGETNRVAVELLTGHIIDILHERERNPLTNHQNGSSQIETMSGVVDDVQPVHIQESGFTSIPS
ncbi:hypothetical protein BASA83_011352 [Batrachochytrium salamandrivorans]|nr:hypothetical protein BASA83_011352 [Batrachochytrium salamandrivorans]